VLPVKENISYFGFLKSPLSYLECVLDGHCERKLACNMLHCDVLRVLRSCPFARFAHFASEMGKVNRLQR